MFKAIASLITPQSAARMRAKGSTEIVRHARVLLAHANQAELDGNIKDALLFNQMAAKELLEFLT